MATEFFLIEHGTGIHLTDPAKKSNEIKDLLLDQYAGAEIKSGAKLEVDGVVYEITRIGLFVDEFKEYTPQIQIYCQRLPI